MEQAASKVVGWEAAYPPRKHEIEQALTTLIAEMRSDVLLE